MLKRRIPPFNGVLFRLAKRGVVIPASTTRKRKRNALNQPSQLEEFTLDKKFNSYNSKELKFKIKQLHEFTKRLKDQVRFADSMTKKDNVHKELAGATAHEVAENDAYDDAEVILGNIIGGGSAGQLVSGQTDSGNGESLSSIILSSSHQVKNFLPVELLKRIDDDQFVLRSLIDRQNRDWNAIITRLYDSKEKLDGISHKSLKTSFLPKLNHLSLTNIRKLDEMLMSNAGNKITGYTIPMYECIFFNLSNLKPSKDAQSNYNSSIIKMMEELLARFDMAKQLYTKPDDSSPNVPSNAHRLEMNQFILNCCIKFASKSMDVAKVRLFLTKFNKEYDLKPNRENYTTIVQFYTKLGLTKEAWDIFATMKFLSAEHRPDETTYNSMLNICSREKNYAKALDLYNEMTDLNIKPTVQTLNIMAKTLAKASTDSIVSEGKSESLRLLGWKYIHEIENNAELKAQQRRGNNWEETLTAMMALSSYDGDVGLARALYFKFVTSKYKENVARWKSKFSDSIAVDFKKIWLNTLNPYIFNYLLLAYANYIPEKSHLLSGYPQGRILRRNIMNSVDYTSRFEQIGEIQVKIPMLPVVNMEKNWQIIAESRALWQFNLEFGGMVDIRKIPEGCNPNFFMSLAASCETKDDFMFRLLHQIAQWKTELVNHNILNAKSLTTFLTIPIKLGDEKEFISRLSEFTYEQNEFDKQVSISYEAGKKELLSEKSVVKNEIENNCLTPEDSNLLTSYFASMKHKLLQNSIFYELIMKAALKFRDSDLAVATWKSRGEFRKSLAFQRLPAEEKSTKDAEFAALMVDFFTQEHMYTDAMAIVMTSQRYINWRYPMIRKLHRELVTAEDERNIKILLQIVNKGSSKENLEYA